MPISVAVLNTVSRQLIIYGGFFLSLAGIIGSCASLYVFTRPRYRRAPCCVFILTGAAFDLILLIIALLTYRTVSQVLQYDPIVFSLSLCKARLYLIDACVSIPIWCSCLATFNRYCITSRDPTQRHWCSFRRSVTMATSLVLAFVIYRSPDLYHADVFLVNGRWICDISPSASIYRSIQIYFTFPVLLTTAPLVLIITLAVGTHAHLRLFITARTSARLEQQITSMVLLQAISAACLIPYTINLFYSTITSSAVKNDYRVAVENLATQIVTLGFYAHYASGFYIYLLASRDIRRSVRCGWRKINERLSGTHRTIIPNKAPKGER